MEFLNDSETLNITLIDEEKITEQSKNVGFVLIKEVKENDIIILYLSKKDEIKELLFSYPQINTYINEGDIFLFDGKEFYGYYEFEIKNLNSQKLYILSENDNATIKKKGLDFFAKINMSELKR